VAGALPGLLVVMFGEIAVLGCPTTIAVAVCGVDGGVNNVRAIAFAGSCGLKIAVVMFGEIAVLGCPTTIAVAVLLGVLFGSLLGLLGGVT